MSTPDFIKSCEKFLSRLAKNNSKKWFEEHRKNYEEQLLYPAQDFVLELGSRLSDICPKIAAIPQIDKSIFRLHKDVRFSRDKAPYKTNLGILFWEGNRKRVECPGFYFHIEPGRFMLCNGIYMFPKELLEKFRTAVSDYSAAVELSAILKQITSGGRYFIGEKKYKRIPKGYDPEYEYSEYYLYGALYVWYEVKNLDEIYDKDPAEFAFEIFKDFIPLHEWLVKYLK
jgi:uncharacterized protein (TIGR02453 family)